MANSCIETSAAPAWLSKLESQREKLGKGKLGHDSGAGAACNACGPGCPGLDLHFWRKVCRACHCTKDVHDVQDDSGWAQFELLGTARPKRSNITIIKVRGIADEPVKLEWVPPNTSPELVSDYMSCLGGGLAPVTGSDGAIRRREQLRRQVPPHDISIELCTHKPTKEEMDNHMEYISQIKQKVVGVGNIVRIGNLRRGDMVTVGTEGSHPVPGTKSYSLPLRLSGLNRGLRFADVPKNGTDKLLVLDNMGNVVNKSAHLQNYAVSPILSRVVKDKLTSMRIESDRVKSAVEHGPVYDRLFKDLSQLNVPVENDVYLSPIKSFRDEYNVNPTFKNETTAFTEFLNSQIAGADPNSLNNNANSADNQKESINQYPQKGTIFALNGEIWSWAVQEPAKSVSIKNTNPHFMSATDNVAAIDPQRSESLKKQNALNKSYEDGSDAPPPPLPNYNTYPGAITGDTSGNEYPGIRSEQNVNKNIPQYETVGKHPQYATGGFIGNPAESGFGNINESKLHGPQESVMDSMVENVGNLHIHQPEFQDSSYSVPCCRCQVPIEEGEIAVKADRAGEDATWHPQCFSCVICKELLADLFYFYHAGEIYCARDLAVVLNIPRCCACDELIFSRSYTAAENKIFHVDHFCCYHCDTPLGGQQYVPDEKSGQPTCLSCYDKYHAEKCHCCKNPIGPEQQGVSWKDFHWHGTCFNCTGKNCGKSLLGGKFIIKNDLPYCSSACVQ